MVVNRKQPTVPQAVSRSASTQHVPTKRIVKNPPKINGVAEVSARASTKKSKEYATKKRRPKTLLDRLFFLSLSLFAFYAFYTCRPNFIFPAPRTHIVETNPLCRSLHSYRVHILDPYILPPVKHTVAFTHDLAEPYIAIVQAKTDPYIVPVVKGVNTVKPYVIRAIDTGKTVWKRALVPFYKGTLKPYYVKAVLPRYRLYIQPRLAPLTARASASYKYYVSRPLHIQTTKLNNTLHRNYRTYVQPYVIQIQPYVVQGYNTVYSVSVQATDAYTTHVHPRATTAWVYARPHLYTAWKHTKVIVLKVAEIAAVQLKWAARQIGAYRRTYVDPHVLKIWEKVAEGTESASAPVPTSTPPPLGNERPDVKAETTESIIEPTTISAAEQAQTTPVPPTEEVLVEDTKLANPSIPTPEENVDAIDPVGESTPVSSSASAAQHTPATVISEAPEPSHTDAPAPVPSEEPEVEEKVAATQETASTPAPAAQAMKSAESILAASLADSTGGDEIDLDAFLEDLGVGEPESVIIDASASNTEPDNPSLSIIIDEAQATQTEEEKLAAIAEKRNRIIDRHEKWFDELDALIANETTALVETLVKWRAEKSAEVADMAGQRKDGGGGGGVIQELQKEGERLIKGLEGYLKKASARSDTWIIPPSSPSNPSDLPKPDRDAKLALSKAEKDKWNTVLAKVESKFNDKVTGVQAGVHAWFSAARERERDDVRASAARVKSLADRAQADLGLDYAWLEDVTYADWQGYHDLMRAFENYEQTAHALQNGTALPAPAPQPPTDPILPALDALHAELQDVILGFSVALGPVRSEAARVFSVRRFTDEDAEGDDEEDSGFFVVRDGEVRKDDLRGVDLGKLGIEKKVGAGVVKGASGGEEKEKADDEVRILPIGARPGQEGEALDPSTIVIGKDRVQVEEALGSVPLEPAAARHEEL
ncbi:hypothetical protein BDN70DRAFT_990961 [Pholiota conissans]|uniref:Uncharacterized protein n=1 Tax=Pholiota conissans TaxID=109636 RepID=A0A9P6D3L5_9AGAR|nr:hypothetical protein BDN70DRAFT_990961 [Pholiota conissans]